MLSTCTALLPVPFQTCVHLFMTAVSRIIMIINNSEMNLFVDQNLCMRIDVKSGRDNGQRVRHLELNGNIFSLKLHHQQRRCLTRTGYILFSDVDGKPNSNQLRATK
jgi:hypothetical protein